MKKGKHGNLKLKHGSSDTSFERAHLVELNAANRISKGLSNQKWRVVLGTHCEEAFHSNISVGTSARPPVQQPTSDDIQESLPNTETEGKPNKNEEPKSQETKKPMKTKSDADHHKNKIRKSEKMVSNHEADETKDLSTPQLQRIVLLQQYKLNKIKLEKETILLETMKKQTIEKSTQTDVTVDDCHTLFTL
ncbi:hypothetical protein J6590_046330 [Homalodisca vitripennis]|nr:hypothetical protein J6590_046330 [Homalodisca vitripennis]